MLVSLMYFIPDAKAVTAQLKVDHGLDRLLGHSTVARETMRGPGGHQGILLADANCTLERLTFADATQRWSTRFGYTSLVGTNNDTPAMPTALARPEQLAGDSIRLLDGQVWMIPKLREWRCGDTAESLRYSIRLPRVMQQSPEDGSFVLGDVVDTYRTLWESSLEIANSMFQKIAGGEAVELPDDQVWAFMVRLMAINYRVDASVLSHLRLLTPELSGQIVCMALDWDTLRAHLKNLQGRRMSGGTKPESGERP